MESSATVLAMYRTVSGVFRGCLRIFQEWVWSLTARVIVVIWVMNGDNAQCLRPTAPCVVDDDVMTKIMVMNLVHGSIFLIHDGRKKVSLR